MTFSFMSFSHCCCCSVVACSLSTLLLWVFWYVVRSKRMGDTVTNGRATCTLSLMRFFVCVFICTFCLHTAQYTHIGRDRERPSIDTLERIFCLCARPHSFWMKDTELCVIEKLFTMPHKWIEKTQEKREEMKRKSNYTHPNTSHIQFQFVCLFARLLIIIAFQLNSHWNTYQFECSTSSIHTLKRTSART